MPTVHHDIIEGRGTALARATQSRSCGNHREDILVSQAVVGQTRVREHLPAKDAKRPDIAVEREGRTFIGIYQELWRHPSNRQQLGPVVIVIIVVKVVTYAEVGNFDSEVRGDETVSCGEVAMNDSLGEEVGHSIGYLEDDPLHVLGCE